MQTRRAVRAGLSPRPPAQGLVWWGVPAVVSASPRSDGTSGGVGGRCLLGWQGGPFLGDPQSRGRQGSEPPPAAASAVRAVDPTPGWLTAAQPRSLGSSCRRSAVRPGDSDTQGPERTLRRSQEWPLLASPRSSMSYNYDFRLSSGRTENVTQAPSGSGERAPPQLRVCLYGF